MDADVSQYYSSHSCQAQHLTGQSCPLWPKMKSKEKSLISSCGMKSVVKKFGVICHKPHHISPEQRTSVGKKRCRDRC